MSDRNQELKDDIAQLQKLKALAQRPNIQNYLTQIITDLTADLNQSNKGGSLIREIQMPAKKQTPVVKSPPTPPPVPVAKPVPVPAPVAADKNSSGVNYTALTKYAWDQEGNKVKIYFTLDGVGKECGPDAVDVIFQKESVTVRLRGYRNQNLIFAIKKLCGEIIPSDSKYLLKTNTLSLTLIKTSSKSWAQLAFKEDSFAKEDSKKQDKDDPQAGLMNMMKKMYEEGDDNMKRTMAQAWSKSRDKNGGGPDFSDRFKNMPM